MIFRNILVFFFDNFALSCYHVCWNRAISRVLEVFLFVDSAKTTVFFSIRMFTLLRNAYIDSRYKLDYAITREELEYLSARVVKLRDLTGTACGKKIKEFC